VIDFPLVSLCTWMLGRRPAKTLAWLLGSDSTSRPPPRRRSSQLILEILEDRIVPTDTNFFVLKNLTGLSSTVGTAWVAGFINGPSAPVPAGGTEVLQANGTFAPGPGPAAITAAMQSGTTVTITATNTFQNNDMVNIAGVGVGGYNGNFRISNVTSTSFQYTTASGLQPSSGGTATDQSAPYYAVTSFPKITLNTATNGDDRLVFAVSLNKPLVYPYKVGYTAYPFPSPAVNLGSPPPGPYDIFEFGLDAQADFSNVDSFGLNLSFTGDPTFPNVTYGTETGYARNQIGAAYTKFTTTDPEGADFKELLYSNPQGANYPPLVDGEYSAIVSPKDWLALNASDPLASYYQASLSAFFTAGNQLSIDLGGLGTYTGSFTGTYTGAPGSGTFMLTRSALGNGPMTETLATYYPAGTGVGDSNLPTPTAFNSTFVFTQGLPVLSDSTQGLLYDALLEAFERGVALDGVFKSGAMVTPGQSSAAWNNTKDWYTDHKNAYNDLPSLYDVYSKFLHYSTINGTDFRNGGTPISGFNDAKLFGQAYGFSLDENPAGATPKFTTTTASGTINSPPNPSVTIHVASTAGFPTNGNFQILTNQGVQTVAYNGTTATEFENCVVISATGTFTFASGATVETNIPWPNANNVPTKTIGSTTNNSTLTLTLGPWSVATGPNLIKNPSFETPALPLGQFVNADGPPPLNDPLLQNWFFSPPPHGAGIASNGSAFTSDNPPAPNGTQVAWIQGNGSYISQEVTLTANIYEISFYAAERGTDTLTQPLDVYVGNTLVGTVTPAGSNYALHTFYYTATASGPQTIKFVGLTASGNDATALIDNVQVFAV
jgi:hypothetical protein